MINKTGDKPAEITVKKDDQKWEVTEKDLDKLPPDIRMHVERMLGGPPMGHGTNVFYFNPNVRTLTNPPLPGTMPPGQMPPGIAPPMPQGPNSLPMDKRLEEMNRRIDEMHRQIEAEMQQRMDEMQRQIESFQNPPPPPHR